MPELDLPPIVSKAIPYTGPCAFCGCGDSRHRLIDAIRDMHQAGDTVVDLADEYGLSVEVVRAICQANR